MQEQLAVGALHARLRDHVRLSDHVRLRDHVRLSDHVRLRDHVRLEEKSSNFMYVQEITLKH